MVAFGGAESSHHEIMHCIRQGKAVWHEESVAETKMAILQVTRYWSLIPLCRSDCAYSGRA